MRTRKDVGSVVERTAAGDLLDGGDASARFKLILKGELVDAVADKPEKEDVDSGPVSS